MNGIARLITCAHTLLVRLYPRTFRTEFEEEKHPGQTTRVLFAQWPSHRSRRRIEGHFSII
jgi:hypothetical protein